MPRMARSRPLTLPHLALRIFLLPFVVMGVLMLGVFALSTLTFVAALLARIFN